MMKIIAIIVHCGSSSVRVNISRIFTWLLMVVSIELTSEQNTEKPGWLCYCNEQKLDYSGLLSHPAYDHFLMSWFLDLFS